VREVMRRHPGSPNPAVAGNCQGGWATLLMAATTPDLRGPIVLNGSPVAAWSGEVGRNPMRYNGGILGGTWQPLLWSDLGHGKFDGAHLVMNFEMLNPSRNYFKKYYDVFAEPERARERFIEFERWWGGFFLLNAEEIRWIVEEIFVGNHLVKNLAQLERGRSVDIKRIQAPIVVFTSHGDNITPPQQALNWIVDTYADVQEIQIRGQRIIYMVHHDVGHLGIFVSSKIAKKEHTEVSSTMKIIEALAPGLYEMKIDAVEGHGQDRHYLVSFAERTFDDIRALGEGRKDEAAFAAVARASELHTELYEVFARPFVKAMVTEPVAVAARQMHPLRMQRAAFSSRNPAIASLASAAGAVMEKRRPVAPGNSFAHDFGRRNAVRRMLKRPEELAALPEVQSALRHMRRGGIVEAVIRMMILMADSRADIRRDRLERSVRVLNRDEPFARLSMDERARIIHEQILVATFAHEAAIETLPDLLPAAEDRELAVRIVQFVAGPIEEMAPRTLALIQRVRALLGLPPATEDVLQDPLLEVEESVVPAQ